MSAHFNNKDFDKNLIVQRIKRINLLIRQRDLKSIDYSLLINKISSDLGIDIDIDTSLADREHYKNNSSEILFNKLTKEDMELIYNSFLFDKQIYEDSSLFWAGK